MVKRLIRAAALALAGVALFASAAFADPDFGAGNSDKKNNDPGAVCSPSPNLDADLPQCK
jgi:hypothetical protein